MIAGVLLAAGRSQRFGGREQGGGGAGAKLVQPLAGMPLVRHAAHALLSGGLDRVYVVLGAAAREVRAALEGLDVAYVHNPRFAEGVGTSVASGIGAVARAAEAAVVSLGDQPFVDPAVVRALVAAWQTSGARIVAPVYDGVRGHPVLFARILFPELLALDADVGAREVIERDRARVCYVPVAGSAPADVNTPADLARLAPHLPGAPAAQLQRRTP